MRDKINLNMNIDKDLYEESIKKLNNLDIELELVIELFLENFLSEEEYIIDEDFLIKKKTESVENQKTNLLNLLKEAENSSEERTFSTTDVLMFLGVF